MPNWMQNTLTVKGDAESLKAFKLKAQGQNGCLDANNFITCPEEILKSKIPTVLSEEEYDWRIKNWGVKWNLDETHLVEEDYTGEPDLIYQFETAWDAPKALIKTMSKHFKTLKFELEYYEPNMNKGGHFKAEYPRAKTIPLET